MLLIHDIGEINIGDKMVFEIENPKGRKEIELDAVTRIFEKLPSNLSDELIELCKEFEYGETKESLLANAIDRVMPVLLNFEDEGQSCKNNNIDFDRVMNSIAKPIKIGLPNFWSYLEPRLREPRELRYYGGNRVFHEN